MMDVLIDRAGFGFFPAGRVATGKKRRPYEFFFNLQRKKFRALRLD
jgi:hypothetical protein